MGDCRNRAQNLATGSETWRRMIADRADRGVTHRVAVESDGGAREVDDFLQPHLLR